jgi:transcriptional regulator with XRE-family HTH domain
MDDFPRRVGARLRELRRLRGFTLQQVEVLSNRKLKGSLLAAYERGDRNISVARLYQISTLYNLPVGELLPEEGASEQPLRPPRLAVDLARLRALPTKQVSILARYVLQLQRSRGDFDTDVITLRTEDLDQLAAAYRTTPEMLARTLQEWGVFRPTSGGEARPDVTGATQGAEHYPPS